VTGLSGVKLAVNIISSLGVSKILGDVIKNNTTVVTTADSILVKAGTLVLGTMVVGKAADHVNATMDGMISKIQQSKEEAENKDDAEPVVVDSSPVA